MQSSKYFLFVIIFLISFQIDFAQWIQTSGPYGGYVRTISGNQEFLIAGTEGAGCFISYDDGDNWIPAREGLPRMINSSLVLGNRIFMGTSYGVFVSDDKGQSWTQTLKGNGFWHIYAITYSPNAIYAGYEEGNIGYIYYSLDNGETWEKLQLEPSLPYLSGISSISCYDDQVYISTLSDGILVNTFGHSEWTRIYTNYSQAIICDSTGLYFATSNSIGFYSFADHSITWLSSSFDGINVLQLLFSNGKLFAATSKGLLYSSDKGMNWSEVSGEAKNLYIYEIFEKGDNLFVGTSINGVFKSTDSGITWNERNNGIANCIIYDLAVHNNILYCATMRGIWISDNFGATWEKVKFNNNGAQLIKIFNDTLYAVDSSDKLFKKFVYDSTWEEIQLPNSSYHGIADFLVKDYKYYLAIGQGLFKSSNHGNSWENIHDQMMSPVLNTLFFKDNIIYVGSGRGMFQSNDEGESWVISDEEMRLNIISSIAGKDSIICAGSNAFYGIYISIDNGITWTRPIEFIQKINVYSILVHENYIITGTDKGLIFSDDLGVTWYSANYGFYRNPPYIGELCFAGNYMFAGVAGGQGLWRRLLSDFQITSISEEFEIKYDFMLAQNYPNPFNPITTIEYYIPSKRFVKLSVYDLLGKEVKVLVNEEKSIGNYKVDFNASGLSSGIYFYKLQSGQFFTARKLIFLK